jgi:hypothetical protein
LARQLVRDGDFGRGGYFAHRDLSAKEELYVPSFTTVKERVILKIALY